MRTILAFLSADIIAFIVVLASLSVYTIALSEVPFVVTMILALFDTDIVVSTIILTCVGAYAIVFAMIPIVCCHDYCILVCRRCHFKI